MPKVPWLRLIGFAVAGTAIMGILLSVELHQTNDWQGGLVDAGPAAPGSSLMLTDFPDGSEYHKEGNHDGAYFYKITRDVLQPGVAAENLDRPRYRLQRILYPVLARMIHPVGTGDGLVWAMLAVNLAGLVLGGVAMGALSVTLRGPPWMAAVFPLLPGCFFALRLSTPDALALAFTLGAIAASLRSRWWLAVLLGVAAALDEGDEPHPAGRLPRLPPRSAGGGPRRDPRGGRRRPGSRGSTCCPSRPAPIPTSSSSPPRSAAGPTSCGSGANVPNTPVETLGFAAMVVALLTVVLAGVALGVGACATRSVGCS